MELFIDPKICVCVCVCVCVLCVCVVCVCFADVLALYFMHQVSMIHVRIRLDKKKTTTQFYSQTEQKYVFGADADILMAKKYNDILKLVM